MRYMLLILSMVLLWPGLPAQSLFPVKVKGQWGLMDDKGNLTISPSYQAIGEFRQFGYAVIQRNNRVGIMDRTGRELIPPQYEDLKILDSLMIAVKVGGEWRVKHVNGQLILDKGYAQVKVLSSRHIAFKKDLYWGVVNTTGQLIVPARYHQVEEVTEQYLLCHQKGNQGLYDFNGKLILPPENEQIDILQGEMIAFKQNGLWGAAGQNGNLYFSAKFDKLEPLNEDFYQLWQQSKAYLFSRRAEEIVTPEGYEGFLPFGDTLVLSIKDGQLGMLNHQGVRRLSNQYDDIQGFSKGLFRVRQGLNWGLINASDQPVLAFQYQFIAPLRGQMIALSRKNGKTGLINFKGEELVSPSYDRIELDDRRAKAYQGENLSLFYFDEEGNLTEEGNFKKHLTIRFGNGGRPDWFRSNPEESENYLLENFEWFFEPQSRKWGLRHINDGTIKIAPAFDWIRIERDLGLTVVGMEKIGRYKLGRTEYRYEMVYGLVNNERGLLISMIDMWDIRFGDFDQGLPVARVIFEGGRHGLINRIGKILLKDYAYIGGFSQGLARMSVKGRLSGALETGPRTLGSVNEFFSRQLSKTHLLDYTLHDKDFDENGVLTCEDCQWGFIDTLGQVRVSPAFDHAKSFIKGVSIVGCNQKWGLIDRQGQELIPCTLDDIHFLKNTENQILRIYRNEQKYGLIDTLGQVTVNLQYDAIGVYQDQMLAVKRDGLWGFVNHLGEEVIDCIYRRVNNFNNGVAVVKFGNKWGVIDRRGNAIIDFKFRKAGNFQSGLLWVDTKKGIGYINRDEQFVVVPQFDKAFDFEGFLARVVLNGKYGLIDQTGAFLVDPQYQSIGPFNEQGIAIVKFSGRRARYGLINREGVILTKRKYTLIEPFQEGFAVVRHKGKYGMINTSGKLVIESKYSKLSGFAEGRAVAQINGTCGYLDYTGQVAIEFNYSKCLDFNEGKAVVYQGYKKGGIVDTNGNYLIEPGINRLVDFSEGRGLVREGNYRFYYITETNELHEGYYQHASEFNHGVAVVQMKDRWGVINTRGIELIAPKYDKIEAFENGFAKVRIKKFSGLVDLEGRLIVPAEYEYINYAGQGLFRVEQGDQLGYLDSVGQWIWTLQE